SNRACPGIRAIQSAADSFENAWYAADESNARWSVSRVKLQGVLTALERSLTQSMPSVPASVRSRLVVVVANVRRGKVVVAKSTSFVDLVRHGYVEVNAAF